MVTEGPPIKYEHSWLHRYCFSPETHHRRAQGSGRLFSGLLAINVVFLGAALISSVVLSEGAVPTQDSYIFLTVLMLLALAWGLYHLLCTRKKPHAVMHQDHHAGSHWLRASLSLFGVCSVLLSIFKIGYDVVLLPCKSPFGILFSCTEILFISVQTSLLWISCKDCIQMQHNATRCGIMLTLATNLLLWFLAVVNDSVHREQEDLQLNITLDVNITCSCPEFSLCWTFQQGYVTLYPFNSEYSLICASMLFIMWKNVGRIDHPFSGSPKSEFRLRGVVYGPLLGGAALVIGICVFIQYQVQASTGTVAPASFLLYYIYNITLLAVMIICCAIGILTHSLGEKDIRGHFNQHKHDDKLDGTREKFKEIRQGQEKSKEHRQGTKVGKHEQDNAEMNEIAEMEPEQQDCNVKSDCGGGREENRIGVDEEHDMEQRGSGLSHRKKQQPPKRHYKDSGDHTRNSSSKNYTQSLEIVLLLGAALGQFSISYFSIVALLATNLWNLMNSLSLAYSVLMILQHIFQNIFIIEGLRGQHGEAAHQMMPNDDSEDEIEPPRRMSLLEMRRVSLAYLQSVGRLSVSRRSVKEIAVFLVLCNVMFWIMSAFGNHPQYTNGLEKQFYGFSAWFSILNFGLPLSVFYRMHSVGALLGVYMET
ncbi:proton channel OTOP3 [Spea bombifrons]|uniref:proton channel OTOP3 n=1 Tax=Spea bombifrons TaxID=233779 RepID=UPI00234A0928|nr:proton channel OTOP3 [Spea bombifrons]